jgi:hypothetical protein
MPPTRTICPACNAALRLTQDVPAGKQIKCPKCGTAFLPTPAADEAVTTAPRSRPPVAVGDDSPRRPRRERGRRPQQKSNSGLIVLAVVGVLVLGVGAFGAIVLAWSLNRKPDVVATVAAPATPAAVPVAAPTPTVPEPAKPAQANVPPDRTEPQPPTPTASIPPVPPGVSRPDPAKPAKPKLSGKEGLDVGDLAMEINAADIDGKKFKLSDYRGKVVVLDFWGNW